VGQCRLWIPGQPPGRQRMPSTPDCDGITRRAPAGTWIVQLPANEDVVRVRVIDSRRAGIVDRVLVYDRQSRRFLREERP